MARWPALPVAADDPLVAFSPLGGGLGLPGVAAAADVTVTATWTPIDATVIGTAPALSFTVDDEPCVVNSVAITNDGGGNQAYLAGEPESSHTFAYTLGFDDDTTFSDMSSSGTDAASAWVALADLLDFASTDADVLSISSVGEVTIHANTDGDGAVDLIATSTQPHSGGSTAATATKTLRANLQPACYDMDLGAATGGPFAGYVGAATFDVPVRINTCGSALFTWEVAVQFDPAVIRPTAAVAGGAAMALCARHNQRSSTRCVS